MEFDKDFLGKLFEQATMNPKLRQCFDLRTSEADTSQRMLIALLPGTVVPIHRHPQSTENVLLLCGKIVEVICDENGNEKERIHLDPTVDNYGCVVPKGAWHTVEVLEPSVIYESKDGKYGEDGSETFDVCLKKRIEDLIEMERRSGSMDVITPLYMSRMLNVPLEEVNEALREC